jgi:hypothetical protein
MRLWDAHDPAVPRPPESRPGRDAVGTRTENAAGETADVRDRVPRPPLTGRGTGRDAEPPPVPEEAGA